MSKSISILDNGNNKKLIIWDKDESATNYEIVGMDNVFSLFPIKKIKSNKVVISNEDLNKYIKLCVRYLYYDESTKKEFILDSTDLIDINKEIDRIELKAIKSYQGVSLSFVSEKVYDMYYVYEKKDNEDILIAQTEDFQVTSDTIKEGNVYYVEGYTRKDTIFELSANSDAFTCKLQKFSKIDNIDLSVVIPAYNAELFLPRTVDSVLLSSLKNIEIIIVNDCSTDNTLDVINWYKKNYKNVVKVYDSEKNEGLSFARNHGIDMAKGEYTAVLDSDDMVHPFMYEQLVDWAKTNNLDICISKVIIRENINDYRYYLNPERESDKDNVIYTFEEMIREKEKNTINNIFFVAVWNKIIRTTLTKAHPYPNYNRYEDNAYTMMIYSYVNKFGFCKKAYYMWDKRFRNTVGTFTTTYNKMSSVVLNICYVTSCFNACKVGNKERLKYLSYCSIKDVFNLLNKNKQSLFANSFAWSYVGEIKDLNKKIDLLKNPYIQNDKALLSFVEKALNYKSI